MVSFHDVKPRFCVINSVARRGRKYDSTILLLSEFCNFFIKKSFSSFILQICVMSFSLLIDVMLDERSRRPGAVSEVLSRPVRNKSTVNQKKMKKFTVN